jgi:hypothetical protein
MMQLEFDVYDAMWLDLILYICYIYICYAVCPI